MQTLRAHCLEKEPLFRGWGLTSDPQAHPGSCASGGVVVGILPLTVLGLPCPACPANIRGPAIVLWLDEKNVVLNLIIDLRISSDDVGERCLLQFFELFS